MLLSGLGSLFVAGCGETPLPGIANNLSKVITSAPDTPIDEGVIQRIAYAIISAKIGSGPRSVLVLGRIDGDDLHWITADRAAVITRGGRVVGTAGFPNDLKQTRFLGEDGLRSPLGSAPTLRLVDLADGNLFGIKLTSTFRYDGDDTVTVLGAAKHTSVFIETCTAETLDWSFENIYWIDSVSGMVWKSVQHYVPTSPPIEMQILRPASKT